MKPIILVFIDYYLPGFKAGGPIRTLSNMIDNLDCYYDFKIVTRDRDINDNQGYEYIEKNVWVKVGNTDIYYISPENIKLNVIRKILCDTAYDVLYLHSFLSPFVSIMPMLLRRFGLIPVRPVIIATRGELSKGALSIKGLKKRFFLVCARLVTLHKNVIWHASTEYEEKDIRRILGSKKTTIVVASDLAPRILNGQDGSIAHKKINGLLRVLFLSRISPMKNLYGALGMLKGLEGNVVFNIFGPIEDADYWVMCQKFIKTLPSNIVVEYCGEVAHEKIIEIFSLHDILLLPTLGENYGHVIVESLMTGCPVLISDRTPWKGLKEKGVGWDLSLEEPEVFKYVLQECIYMEEAQYLDMSNHAKDYWIEISNNIDDVQLNKDLFEIAMR